MSDMKWVECGSGDEPPHDTPMLLRFADPVLIPRGPIIWQYVEVAFEDWADVGEIDQITHYAVITDPVAKRG